MTNKTVSPTLMYGLNGNLATNTASSLANLDGTYWQFQYDPLGQVTSGIKYWSDGADGNLTSDGRWNYTWDGENRLIFMTNNNAVGPQLGLYFTYDAKGRRIGKTVITATSTNSYSFVYDGWNLLAELTNNVLLRAYDWGLDLSGSMQVPGGVGGLLEMKYYGSQTTNCFTAFDGNGNMSALVNAANGSIIANYEYGPFGELIRASGPMAKTNPFRFSTKYQDDESDHLYYGYRYLNASTGRWLSRDTIEEAGGCNLYGFVNNCSINGIDYLGEFKLWEHIKLTEESLDQFYKDHPQPQANAHCIDDVRIILTGADAEQDINHFEELERHYNRPPNGDRATWDLLYVNYITGELARFNSDVHRHECLATLQSLGLLTHSWQDLYAHAIRRDGKGGKENSDYPGWTAFSVGITGNPYYRDNFWPSSYVGEHPRFEEPVDPGSAEGIARQNAAVTFVTTMYDSFLTKWYASCQCLCNSEGLE